MKKIIRNFLQRYGYDIVKTGVPYIKQIRKKEVVVSIGKYKVLMPGNNIQYINYQLYPDLNSQLAGAALFLYQKYPDMTMIDVGANVGDTIAVVKSVVNIPVIAVEGDEISYQFLEKNIRQFSNVTAVKTFLGEKSQNVKADFGSKGWNATIIPSESGGHQVSFKTLDEVILKSDFAPQLIKLLKIDVEGFDTIVLRGASALIQRYKPVLFFEYNRAAMKNIREDGLSTVLSFSNAGYNKIMFFDHKGTFLVSTSLKNEEIIIQLDEYLSSDKNLLGYYDICLFHKDDNDVADKYIEAERKKRDRYNS